MQSLSHQVFGIVSRRIIDVDFPPPGVKIVVETLKLIGF